MSKSKKPSNAEKAGKAALIAGGALAELARQGGAAVGTGFSSGNPAKTGEKLVKAAAYVAPDTVASAASKTIKAGHDLSKAAPIAVAAVSTKAAGAAIAVKASAVAAASVAAPVVVTVAATAALGYGVGKLVSWLDDEFR